MVLYSFSTRPNLSIIRKPERQIVNTVNLIILCQCWLQLREVAIWLIRCFSLHLQLTCYCVSAHQNRWTSWRRDEPVSSTSTSFNLFISHSSQRKALFGTFYLFLVWNFWTLFPPAPLHNLKYTANLLTSSCSLADKSNELLLYFLHSIQIIHEKDMPITGFAGNIYKLSIVCICKADGKYDVAWKWNWKREFKYSEMTKGSQSNQCWYYVKRYSQCIHHNFFRGNLWH